VRRGEYRFDSGVITSDNWSFFIHDIANANTTLGIQIPSHSVITPIHPWLIM